MRFVLPLLLMLGLSHTASAQVQPLLEADKIWTHTILDPWAIDVVRSFAVTYQKDTVLNGTAYWRPYTTGDSTYQNFQASGYSSVALREDSTGRVFRYDFEMDTESLLIDFTMGIGDTLPPLHDEYDCPVVVTDVRTVVYDDGIPRKLLEFSAGYTGSGQLYRAYDWVEGIGNSLYALNTNIYNCIVDGVVTPVNCVSRDGVLLYDNPNVDGCFYTAAKPLPDAAWSLSPNPTARRLTLQVAEPVHQLSIYSMQGQLLLQQQGGANIDLQSLPAGTYLLRARIGDYAPVQQLIVKQ